MPPPSRVEYQNERIPTLKEAVALCKQLDLIMLIELKNTSDIEKVIIILNIHSIPVHSIILANCSL
jgi:hypothetical protein